MLLGKCRKCRESKNPRTKNERIVLFSNCVLCDSKKSKFVKICQVV